MVFPEGLIKWMKEVNERLDNLQTALELQDKLIKQLESKVKGST